MATFQLYYSVQRTGGISTGSDPENRVSDQDNGNPGRPVTSGLQVTGEPGYFRAGLGDFPAAGVFPSKCPSIAPAEMSNIPR
jgi:hypothetical protein